MMTAYFDNASTTPVDPRVIDKMRACPVLLFVYNMAGLTFFKYFLACRDVTCGENLGTG